MAGSHQVIDMCLLLEAPPLSEHLKPRRCFRALSGAFSAPALACQATSVDGRLSARLASHQTDLNKGGRTNIYIYIYIYVYILLQGQTAAKRLV